MYEFGSILPAKLGGKPYRGYFFGSEVSKRCRELRNKFILVSKKDGKFERYYLKTPQIVKAPIYSPQFLERKRLELQDQQRALF